MVYMQVEYSGTDPVVNTLLPHVDAPLYQTLDAPLYQTLDAPLYQTLAAL